MFGKQQDDHEKRTFFQWFHFVTPYVYALGIILIIEWIIISLSILGWNTWKDDPRSFFLQPKTTVNATPNSSANHNADPSVTSSSNTNTPQSKDTWMKIFIKPIVESNFNKIIFKGLFTYNLDVVLSCDPGRF